MDLIPNDWRQLATLTQTSQKPFLRTFYYNNKDTRRVKIIQKLFYKDILQQTF